MSCWDCPRTLELGGKMWAMVLNSIGHRWKDHAVIISKILTHRGVYSSSIGCMISCILFQLEQFEADTRSQGEAIHRMLFRYITYILTLNAVAGCDNFILLRWLQWKDQKATVGRLTKVLFNHREYEAISCLQPWKLQISYWSLQILPTVCATSWSRASDIYHLLWWPRIPIDCATRLNWEAQWYWTSSTEQYKLLLNIVPYTTNHLISHRYWYSPRCY